MKPPTFLLTLGENNPNGQIGTPAATAKPIGIIDVLRMVADVLLGKSFHDVIAI
jgi:hypothetical protein